MAGAPEKSDRNKMAVAPESVETFATGSNEYIMWNQTLYVQREESLEDLLVEGLTRNNVEEKKMIHESLVKSDEKLSTNKASKHKMSRKTSRMKNYYKSTPCKKLHHMQVFRIRFVENLGVDDQWNLVDERKRLGIQIEIGTNEYQRFRAIT